MTQLESDAIVMYLHGARIDWSEKITPLVLLVWFDALRPFRAEMAQEAVKGFHGQRPPGKQGFPPDVGEVVEYLYRCGQAEDLRARPANDHETAAKLLTGPIDAWGEAQSLPALSVALVRDLMDGTVEPGSDEHQRRQGEIEALARVGVSPCCDRDGLTSYEVIAHGIRRTNAARCDCARGHQSAYRSYPMISRERGQAEMGAEDIARGRQERGQRIAEYHAAGAARLEPCTAACQHGASIPLSRLSGGLQ